MKPFREALRGLLRRLDEADPSLSYLFLELTRACNLSCRHCGSDCSAEASARTLLIDDWARLIPPTLQSFDPPPFVVLTGGEPLVLARLEELGRLISSSGSSWGMVTNGLLLDEKRLDSLLAAGLSSLTISLDGMEASHDWLRGKPGAWKGACAAIGRAAARSCLLFDVVTCVHPSVMDELDAVVELLHGLGVKRWRLFRVFPKGRAADGSLTLDRLSYGRLLEWLEKKRPKLKMRGLEAELSCDGWLPAALERRLRPSPLGCQAGIRIASILADGSVTGCPNNHPGLIQGSVLEESLASIWARAFAHFRDRSWVMETDCAACADVRLCRGGSMHAWDWPPRAQPGACWKN